MAYDVEDKVVQMRFDNRDFDPNIDASIKSLEKLEAALKFEKAKDGINDLQKTVNKFSLSNFAKEFKTGLIDGLTQFETVGRTILYRFTDSAITELNKLKNAFIIAPLSSGWGEYSEQMNSTQVIMSNTGDSLAKITKNLDELNEYADRTIYSFGQMTTAIGKFAAAGVELNDATKAIKGLSSAAATVGASNQQLFSAYYNLAQSLQLGYVQLIDWKSLENSTIGNKTMREAFIKTAIEMGKFTEASEQAQKAYADFRGSLSSKWLTTDVVLTTLQKYSRAIKMENGVYYDFDESTRQLGNALKEVKDSAGEVIGYISDTYGELSKWEVELGVTAYKSATEIKSFQQMWDTLTEAAGTGWAETWKVIFGDLEQAKDLWTDVSNSIEKVITAFTNLRNEALKGWKSWGGYEDLKETIKSLARIFENLGKTVALTMSILTGSTTGFEEDLNKDADSAGKSLALITKRLRIFVTSIEKGTEKIQEHARALAKVLTPLKWVAKALGFVVKLTLTIIVIGDALIKTLINIVMNLKDLPELIKQIFGESAWNRFATVLNIILTLGKLLCSVLYLMFSAVEGVVNLFIGFEKQTGILSKVMTGLATVIFTVSDALITGVNALSDWLFKLSEIIRIGPDFKKIFNDVASFLGGSFVQGIVEGFKKGSSTIVDGVKTIGTSIITTLENTLEINSPSKKGIAIGGFFIAGIVAGILGALSLVSKTSSKIGETAVNSTKKSMSFKGTNSKKSNIGGRISAMATNIKNSLGQATKSLDDINGSANEADKKTNNILENVKTHLENIGDGISEFYKNTLKPMIMNLNTGKVLAIGFSVAIIAFIFAIGAFFDKFGNMFTSLGQAAINFVQSIGRMADGVVDNLKAMAAETRSKAFEHISDAIFTIAKALALLTLVAAWNPDGLKQAAIMLGIFAGSIGLLVAAFTILYNKIQQLQSIGDAKKAMQHFAEMGKTMARMVSMSAMILAITIAMATMTKSIATLSEMPIKDALKGLAIVELLMASLVGVVFVLSKFTPQLTRGTLLMFAFAYAVKLFSSAMASIGGNLEDGIQRLTNMSVGTYVKLILLIGVLTVFSTFVGKASTTITKVVMSLTMLSIGLGLMAFMISKINADSEVVSSLLEYLTSGKALTALILLIGALTVSIILISKFAPKIYAAGSAMKQMAEPLSRLALSLSAIIVSLAAVIGVIAFAKGNLSNDDFNSVMASFAVIMVSLATFIGGIIAALYGISIKAKKSKLNSGIFENFNKVLGSIALVITALTLNLLIIVGAMSMFWNKYGFDIEGGWMVLGSAIAMLAALSIIIAGLIAVVGSTYKANGVGALKLLIPTIFMIGELIGAVAILAAISHDTDAYWSALDGIAIIMGGLALVIAAIGTLQHDSKTELASGSKSEKSFNNTFKIIVTIVAGIAAIIGEIGALTIILGNSGNYDAFSKAIAMYGIVMISMWSFIALLAHYSKELDSLKGTMFKNLVAVISGTILIIGALAGIMYIVSSTGVDSLTVTATLGGISIAMVAIFGSLTFLLKEYDDQRYNKKKLLAIISMLGTLSLMIGAFALFVRVLDGIDAYDISSRILGLTAGVSVISLMVIALSKWTGKATDIKKALPLLISLTGIMGAIAGMIKLTENVDAASFATKLAAMDIAIMVLTKIAMSLAKASNETINKANLGILIATMAALTSAIPIFTASIAMLQNIDINKVGAIFLSMGTMVTMFALLAGVFVGFSYAIQKIPVPYIGLAIAVLGGITVAMLAFAGAILILNSVSLDQLVDNLAALFNVGWQMAGVGMAFIALGLGMAVLGAGLTPVAVALLIVAGAIFIFATAAKILIDSFEKSSQTLKDFTEAINNVDFEAVERLFNLLNKLSIISMASFPGLAAMAAFIKQLTNMISALPAITEVIVPFTEALADAGKIISDNQTSITALADNIKKLGLAILTAAPAVIALAVAFGIVVTSIGLALLLAAPFALSLGLALTALAAVILHMKDATIALFNAVMNRLPEIAAVVESMKDSADIMISVGQGLSSFGFGLMMLGLGGVVGALGLLALAGALAVLNNVLTTVIGPANDLEVAFLRIWANGGRIAALGAALTALGLGLLVLGVGSLVGGIGLLALSGALAVLNNVLTTVIGPANDLEEAFLRIWANGGRIAALGAAFVALGIGLIAVGAGSLVAGVGLLALSVGLISLAIPTVIIVAALSIFVLVITNLVNSITGCINAITMFTMALVILANTGNLIVTGIGLFLVAGGFAAVGAAVMLLAPIIPIILLVVQVMTQVTGILYTVGDAIEYFTSKLETSSVSIGNSMMNIANSFVNAISVIKEGIASLSNLGNFGANAATNVVKGFCGGIISKLPFFKKSTEQAADATKEGFSGPEALDFHSPSKWFAWAGRMCSSGFDKSIAGEMPKFFGSGEDAGEGVISGFVDGLKEKAKSSKVGKVISSVVDVATGKASLGDIADKYIGKDTPLGKVVDTVKGIWSGDGLDLSKTLGIDISAFEEAASGAGDYTSALGDAGSAAGSTKGTIESLTDTLKNQMKIFERFTADEEMMKPAELINNMKSQLRGMQNWANGIDMLAVRGMSGPLLQYLAEMGPEGYKYVEAFLEMTEDEFAQANDLYAQSLEMPSNTANQIADSYRLAGVEIVDSVASGMSGNGAARAAMDGIGKDVTESTEETAKEVYQIADTEAKATAEDLEVMAAKSGEVTGWSYFTALDQWMDSTEAAKYIASVQGKIQGKVFSFSNFDMAKAAAQAGISGYDYIEAGWNYKSAENLKKLSATSAKFIVEGYTEALTGSQYLAACQKAMYGLAATVIDAGEESFEINSPSKVTFGWGRYIVEGLANGISKYIGLADEASTDLADSTMGSLATTIQAISSQFTDDMDTTPTIRPVLDLNNVYTGMAELDTMFSTNQARIAGSAYMTTHDDSVERLEEAYRKAIMDGNLELANMLLNSEDTNVIVDVHLDANAEGIFDLVKVENEKATKRSGASPLMIARRNAVQASLVRS